MVTLIVVNVVLTSLIVCLGIAVLVVRWVGGEVLIRTNSNRCGLCGGWCRHPRFCRWVGGINTAYPDHDGDSGWCGTHDHHYLGWHCPLCRQEELDEMYHKACTSAEAADEKAANDYWYHLEDITPEPRYTKIEIWGMRVSKDGSRPNAKAQGAWSVKEARKSARKFKLSQR